MRNSREFASMSCVALLLVLSTQLLAQESLAPTLPQITRVDQDAANITVDGFIDEEIWKDLPVIDGMKVTDPE